jgi:hypothetical protein
MAPQLPEFRPEKVAEALAAFPPKLSALAEVLTAPEEMFEQQAAAAGVPVPPGPAKMAVQFMQSIESMAPAAPFGVPLSGQGTQQAESLGEVKTVEVQETPKRSRVEVEILEA